MGKALDQILGIEKGKVLAPLTTFQIGGPADYYFQLKNVDDLPSLIEACLKDKLPYIILGWGSNIIFSEKGFRGLIIHNLTRHIKLDGELIVTESGALLSQIIQFSLKNGLTGMEKLMGLPGSIGGAVRGNAGAFGLEIKHLFVKAEIYCSSEGKSEKKGVRIVPFEYLDFNYRHSHIKKTREIIMRVWLKLEKGDTTSGVEEVRKIIMNRAGKHPSGMSSGSFFKNPSGNSVGKEVQEGEKVLQSAGYYSDNAGCKSLRIRGAYVSEKHANFLMNDGTATLEDVLKLCEIIQQRVLEKFGIRLEREVQLVGENGFIEQ